MNLEDNVVNVDLVIDEAGDAFVICDRAFNKSIGWFEYDHQKASLDFVMDDGETRNYGIPVARDIQPYFLQHTQLTYVLKSTDGGEDYASHALIVHKDHL